MYIRMATLSYDPAQEEAVKRLVDEQAIPAFKRLPGFGSYAGGLDRGTQQGVVVTTWDNMDHAAGLRIAMSDLVQQFEAVGVRFDPAQIYELIAQA